MVIRNAEGIYFLSTIHIAAFAVVVRQRKRRTTYQHGPSLINENGLKGITFPRVCLAID